MENLGLVGFTGAGANRLFSALTGLAASRASTKRRSGVASGARRAAATCSPRCRSRRRSSPPASSSRTSRCRPGSKPGEGLGAKFIGTLRNCDAILIVLRAFDDGLGAPDPDGDLAALELELVLADLGSVEQRLNRQRRAAKSGDKEIVGRGRGARAGARRCSPTARRSARSRSRRRRARAARARLPAHRQAAARRRQHRRGARRPTARVAGRRARGPDRHRGRDRGVRARGPRRDARDVRPRRVGARHRSRTPRTTCSAGARSSRPARTSRARGRSAPAPRRPSARASSTPTCSAASSGPR